MKKKRAYIASLPMIVLLCIYMSFLSMAAADGEITSVSLKVTADITADSDAGDLTVTTTGTHYHVASYDFVSSPGAWKVGDIPRVKVVLETDEDYFFSKSMTKSKVRLNKGTCSGVRRLDSGSSMEVSIKLDPVKGEAGEIGEAYWQANPLGKAKWDQSDNAGAYELRLYRGNTLVKKVDKTTTNTYDFYPYMTKAGEYVFWVRGIPRNTNESDYLTKGDWKVSAELIIEKNETASSNSNGQSGGGSDGPGEYRNTWRTGWVQDGNGWWYSRQDGTWPVTSWELIGGKWYLFDKNGYMLTGWQTRDGGKYYLTSNGDMVTGWNQLERQWYFMGEDGAVKTGWLDWNGNRYYLNSDGTMMTGWSKFGNDWYYFDPVTGASVKDQVVDRYYLNRDGIWVPS